MRLRAGRHLLRVCKGRDFFFMGVEFGARCIEFLRTYKHCCCNPIPRWTAMTLTGLESCGDFTSATLTTRAHIYTLLKRDSKLNHELFRTIVIH